MWLLSKWKDSNPQSLISEAEVSSQLPMLKPILSLTVILNLNEFWVYICYMEFSCSGTNLTEVNLHSLLAR